MIVHYQKTPKTLGTENNTEEYSLHGFASLFSYASQFLSDLYTRWPDSEGVVNALAKEETTKEKMIEFSSNHGKLFLLVYALFPKVKDEKGEISTQPAKREDVLKFMQSSIESIPSDRVIHVSLSSIASSVIEEREWLSFFASSEKKFALYH